MTASLYPGRPLLTLSSTACPYTSLAQTPAWSTTPPTPIWPSLAWMLARSTSSGVSPGTQRTERERAVCTSTRQHVRRHWDTSLCVFILWTAVYVRSHTVQQERHEKCYPWREKEANNLSFAQTPSQLHIRDLCDIKHTVPFPNRTLSSCAYPFIISETLDKVSYFSLLISRSRG